MDINAKIKELEDEIETTKYNKATQLHIGKLKAKIAALKEKQETRKRGKSKGLGFGIKKEGHATIIFAGLPSVGKSTILNKLTNARSQVADYEFTTLDVIPGMLEYEGLRIQLLDVPGLIIGAADGKGRGKEVLSMVRNADVVIIVLDVTRMEVGEVIKQELENIGIRLDKKKPDVTINRTDRGGITITRTCKTKKFDDKTAMNILQTKGMHNAQVIIREEITDDEFIDALWGNRVYLPSIVVVNKTDLKPDTKFPKGYLPISAERGENLERLKEIIFSKLTFIRIYLKPQGGKADYTQPMIVEKGQTVEELCNKLHKDMAKKFRYALIWGPSAKHDGQRCGLSHILKDKDTVTIVKEL